MRDFKPRSTRKPAYLELAGHRKGWEGCHWKKQPQEFHNAFDFLVDAFGIGGLGCNPRDK